jgi:uncharacterized protein YkwD
MGPVVAVLWPFPAGHPGNQAFTPPVVQKPAAVLPPPGVKHVPRLEDLVFELTNQARQAKGLPPLIHDAELTQVARAFSDDMLVRRFFDHTTPDGVTFDERLAERYPHRVRLMGENIGRLRYNVAKLTSCAGNRR